MDVLIVIITNSLINTNKFNITRVRTEKFKMLLGNSKRLSTSLMHCNVNILSLMILLSVIRRNLK